jgi:hypothetical protein
MGMPNTKRAASTGVTGCVSHSAVAICFWVWLSPLMGILSRKLVSNSSGPEGSLCAYMQQEHGTNVLTETQQPSQSIVPQLQAGLGRTFIAYFIR